MIGAGSLRQPGCSSWTSRCGPSASRSSGFGGVIVRADHRGRGLAREVAQAALAKARTLGPAFALLFCHEDRAGLYRKLGFAEIISEVVVKQPDGCAPMP